MLPQYSKLSSKKVLLIGGTSGIGLATAALVLEHNGIAIISSSQPSKIESALQRLRTTYPDLVHRVTGFPCDLSDPDTLDANLVALFESALAFNPSTSTSQPPSPSPPPIHHITFTAGNAGPITPFTHATPSALAALSQVRYTAAVFVAKHAPRYLAPGPESSITFTSNVSDLKPPKGWALSTGATSLTGLVSGAAVDLAPVRANLVKVGWVETERLWAMIGGEGSEEGRRMVRERERGVLTGRVGRAEDVAEAYVYLMKDWNVTGQAVVTDGGFTLT